MRKSKLMRRFVWILLLFCSDVVVPLFDYRLFCFPLSLIVDASCVYFLVLIYSAHCSRLPDPCVLVIAGYFTSTSVHCLFYSR